ncbi:DUF4145 domain-containing protein [Pantoea sp. PNT02]|uniref:DUF4145 domain-containing protein n=1 Tax=Pantoea sp. PNT02 TaxID=2769261 RepID=UPI00177BC1C3|nr:DUF4145 domain-containing protein [Pantoea sp. PNT02]MBD9642942.1 DUF4145 domain-containing protein [Pantoea sp. PNT02]
MANKMVMDGLCPRCDGSRKSDIHGSIEKSWDHDAGMMHGKDKYFLLECRGCETVYTYIVSINSEDTDYRYDHEVGQDVIVYNETINTFPSINLEESTPEWVWQLRSVDRQLHTIISEIYSAYDKGSLILASIGLRTAFDRATEVLQIDPAISLQEKVSALLKEGFIGQTEADVLKVITEVGNAAAHRAWSPSKEEFASLIGPFEHFITRNILSEKNFELIKEKIPAKPKRKKD